MAVHGDGWWESAQQDMKPDYWVYLGEGSANMVLSYRGPHPALVSSGMGPVKHMLQLLLFSACFLRLGTHVPHFCSHLISRDFFHLPPHRRCPPRTFTIGQNGRVLRVCKRKFGPDGEQKSKPEAGIPAPSHNDKILTKAEQSLWAHSPQMVEARERVELQHAFLTEVMAPLLGSDVVCPGVSRSQ